MPTANRSFRILALMALLGLLGCPTQERGETEPPAEVPEGAPPPPSTSSTEAKPASASPASLESLSPVISTTGQTNEMPERIEIRFKSSVVAQANTRLADGTDAVITPSIPGRWSFSTPSTLVFTPRQGFRPSTEYLVELRSVQNHGGVSTGDRIFQHVFTTPALKLDALELTQWSAARGVAEIELVFTGPVAISRPRRAIVWEVDGIRRRLVVSRGRRPNRWKVTLRDRGLRPGSIISASVSRLSVASTADARVFASGSAQVSLPKEKAVYIRGVAAVEGADGFFIRIVCDDEASRGRRLSFYDREMRQRFRLSPRCMLDDASAKEKLRLEPAVDFTLSPTRGGFRIHAPVTRGTVEVVLEAGARSVDGGVTVSRFRRALKIPARRPKLEFVAQGRYLPPSAWGSLALRHQNVSKADLQIRHVSKNNVVRWLSDSGDATSNRNSDLIDQRELDLEGMPDSMATSVVDVTDYVPKPPAGVVEIQVRQKPGSARSTVRFAVTDLNVVAKRQRDGSVRAWVLRAHDHRPVSQATVEMVVFSGRVISKCRTDRAGGCTLAGVIDETVDKTEPFALLAEAGQDFTFVRFDQLRLDTSGFDVHGVSDKKPGSYRSSVYSDRGVYRPGDTAHVVAILRTAENQAPPAEMPVQVELIDPKQKVSRRRNLQTNEAGIVASDFSFADFADTGRYRAVFKVGDRVVGSYSFSVEEFVPERMEVSARADKENFGAEDEAPFDVSARYLFGGSAAGSRVDVQCSLTPVRFAPKQHPGYAFEVWQDRPVNTIQLGQVSGVLDQDGAGQLRCPSLTGRGRLRTTARLRAQVAVFESGSGRTTRGEASAQVHPTPFYIGLKSDTDRVTRDKSFRVEGVIVDWQGEIVDTVAKVELELLKVEREYGWVYDELEGRWTNRRHAHLVRTQRSEVAVSGGRFSLSLKTPESATAYVVRASAGDVMGDLRLGGVWGYWWYGYGYSNADATPRPIKPDAVQIVAPAEAAVGDDVEVGFEAPYAGRALWTVESDGVKKTHWQDVVPGPVKWSFRVDAFEPNVYVSVLLLKDPHEESKQSYLPSRSYGVTSVRLRPTQFIQPVQIKVPKEVRSSSTLEVEVSFPSAEKPTYVTVAAVDEGILSLTGYKTPSPVEELFKRQGLGVSTFETIGWNVSLPAGDLGRSTGGGGAANPGRIQMVKPVALWSGLRKVPDQGPLKVTFKVPQYRGKLRVMVVGAGPRRLVSAADAVVVRDPIVLQTTLPRFLVQGDRAQIPVFLSNLSGRPQNVTVRLSSAPSPQSGSTSSPKDDVSPIAVRGPDVRTVALDKDGQATVVFNVDARAVVGGARLQVEAKTKDLRVVESLDVPFSPNLPRARTVQRIEVPPGTLDLKPYLKGWLPTTESSTFWVTANPYGEALDHLKYLVRYPYGCVEQTTSVTRPLLFLGGLVRSVDPDVFDAAKLEASVTAGIDRVLSMQTPSGGFGYWPGASRPVYWGTAYATHMLIDARKRGFDVPQDRIDDALTWMARALNTSDDREQAFMAKPYMHFVLALGGRGAKASMLDLLSTVRARRSKLRPRTSDLQSYDEMVFLLQAGLYAAGDQRFENELLAADVTPIQNVRTNGWTFYSDQRRRGLVLSILVDLLGPRAELEPLAQVVSEGLTGHRSYWYTTQELAWGITGLGKLLGDVTKSFTAPTLIGNGRSIAPRFAPASKDDLGDRTFSVYRASEYDSLSLKAAHGADDKVYLVISSDGVRRGGQWRTGGQDIRVERRYRDERGEVIDPRRPIALGDLIYVELNLRNTTGTAIQNVAVVDRFVAGWEIENPRLGRDARAGWLDSRQRWYPEHMNIRDDRIEAFGTLAPKRTVKLVYLLRAVTAGTFTTPPVEAEAMYDPARWARELGPQLTVRGPWDDR